MSKFVSMGTVLLLSSNHTLQVKITQERSGAPLLCLDSLAAGYRYLNMYNDVDTVCLDSSLLTGEVLPALETKIHQLCPRVKITYLLTSTSELAQLPLPKNSLFRVVEITS